MEKKKKSEENKTVRPQKSGWTQTQLNLMVPHLVGAAAGGENSGKKSTFCWEEPAFHGVSLLARALTCAIGLTLQGGVRSMSQTRGRFHLYIHQLHLKSYL